MAKEKLREIHIKPFMDHGKKTWQLEVVHNGKKGGPGNYPPIDVPPKFAGNFQITILDGEGITFSNDPIWIQAGTAKPAGHVIDPQITKIKGKNETVLTFHDANSGEPMTLTYQLNFNNAVPLDPIIQNGGGGGQPTYEYALYAAGAFLLGALLLALYSKKRLKKEHAHPMNNGKP